MRKIYILAAMLATSLLAAAQSNFTQAALTPGNLVVYRVGTGTGALSSSATAVFLDEYTTSGTLVQSIALPTAAAGSNHILTASGTATTEGLLTLSADGRYIVLAGYDAAPGTASITGSTAATVPRVIGRLDPAGTLNTTTALTDAISGSNPRGACSTDGNDLWISGSASAGGVRYTTLGATTSTSLATTPTNLRGVDIFGGQLYISSGAGTIRIGTVGTGTPMTSGQTITALPGVSITGSFNQFFFADLNPAIPGLDVLYLADDGGNLIQKYSFDGVTWTLNGTVTASAVRGLTGKVSGSNVILYYTFSSATKLTTLTDAGGWNNPVSGMPVDIATAATNTAFRGVAFAPVLSSTAVLSVTPSSLSGFITTPGTPSANQSFTVSGSNLNPAGSTITVTSNSAAIEISPDGITYSSSFTFTATGTNVSAVTVYVRLSGTSQGPISGTVSVSGGGAATQNVTVSGTVVRSFYSKSTGSLAAAGTYGTNIDGTGTAPADFTSDGQIFVVTNRASTTLDANLTISGASSKLIIGDGTSNTELIIPAGFTLTALTDVSNHGKLTLQNTVLPTFGTLAAGSTIEYAQAAAISILNTTTDNITYSNLTLSGAGVKTFKGSTTTVTGNIVYDGQTNGALSVEAAAATPFTTINLGGDLTYLGTVSNPSDADSYTLTTTGTGTQTITGNGNTARFFRINSAATNNIVLVSTTALLGNASGGGLTLNAGTTLNLNGNDLSFFAGTTTGISGTGTITGSALSNITLNKIGTTAFGTLNFTTGAEQLNSLVVNINSTTTPTVTLGTKLDVNTLDLTAGKIILGANNLGAGTIAGGSATAYAVTNGAGALKINNVGAAAVVFPVGPSATLYHPATISNSGTVDNYAVKVAAAAPPCADPNYSVTATWNISEDVAGGSNCALTFSFAGAATGAAYDAAVAKIIHCTGTTADYKNGTVTGTTATGAGFMNFSPFGVSSDPIVLAVNITNLKGTAEGKYNHLSWSTAQESNNSGFEIQRSADGVQFDAIGFVKSGAANGNSAATLNYVFDDHTFSGMKQYYRLRQTDLSGQSRLTNTILINSKTATALAIDGIYPNPASEVVNISVTAPAQTRVTLIVTDAAGKRVAQEIFTAAAGKNIFSLHISSLTAGSYTIKVSGGDDGGAINLIKK